MNVKRIVPFVEGYALTWLSFIFFGAFGWVTVIAPFDMSKFFVPGLIAIVAWISLYLLSSVVLRILGGWSVELGFLGFIGVSLAIGYGVLSLTTYVLPAGWVSIPSKDDPIIGVGVILGIILFFVRREETRISHELQKALKQNVPEKRKNVRQQRKRIGDDGELIPVEEDGREFNEFGSDQLHE